MSNLLDKFYGDGKIYDRYGLNAGYISHLNDKSALVYDRDGRLAGRIDVYGNEIDRTDENGILIERGRYYEELDSLVITNIIEGTTKSEITCKDNVAYESSKISPDYDKSYTSSCSYESSSTSGYYESPGYSGYESSYEDDEEESSWLDDLFDD